ncbi:MAG: Do family serine endopeptidase [Pseudomonadota bacterium]
MMRFLIGFLIAAIGTIAVSETRVPESQAEISIGFVPVVQKAAPAVVNIYARRVVNGQASLFRNDPFFRDFFRNFGSTRPRVQNSLGSGVILSDDGIVVSNFHVVGGATDIRVVLNDQREFSAKLLLSDQESDLAILKLEDAEAMPALTLRDSDTVQVGELVLAIGNPFGVGQTVTSGIVSGLARSGSAAGGGRGYFIQTDAPINPGNSGGALVDINGHLIGINTRILSRSGGSNGIGFAIPAALVEQFVAQARENKSRFERPWAGISAQPVTSDVAEGLGIKGPGGIIITQIHPASPFAEAGFKTGDVIAEVDGAAVNTASEMVFRMAIAGLGEETKIRRLREGIDEQVTLKLGLPPEDPPRATQKMSEGTQLPGLEISTINPAVISELGLPFNAEGVVVVDPGAKAARAGLRKGDILHEVNGESALNPATVEKALMRTSRWLWLEVQRGKRRSSLRLRL